ncbi:MAG TPA: efflux RND transporter periplasmic adaptor subunit [Waddliaceae bacterium]
MCKLGAHGDHHEESVAPEEFNWTKEKTEFADIQVQIAGVGEIKNFIQVAGKIIIHPDHLAYVTPKIHGAVWEIRKNLGDWVERGEVLAIIESREIAEAKANYLATAKKLTLHQTVLKKEEMLREISPEQDYLNAKLTAEETAIQLRLAIQGLYALGFTEQEINKIGQDTSGNLRFYAMKAPLTGKVLQRNLTLGELCDHATKAFTIANFDKVWVEMSIPQNNVHYLKEGLPVEITGACGKKGTVQICQFNPIISEETRTATAIAVVDSMTVTWTPGEFITAHVLTDVTKVPIVVPWEAIQHIKGEHYIFVEKGSEFVPSIVKIGKIDDRNVEIVSGLNEGEGYAACNTFCLKAELEKEEAEHTH